MMEIQDLSGPFLDTYCHCLEDWSDEIKEAGDHKRLWYERMKDRGLRVKLAVADGRAWVHGHQQGVGNRQKRGLGTALLRAAAEFGDVVEFQGISTEDRAVFLDWGIADGLFVDGRPVRTGPPPSYKKIRRKIARRVKRAKGRGPDRVRPA